jgi:multisubunit Na+/H+ antiporter MnhB subunit
MINLASVAVNLLWVLGLTVILAALGYYDWLARERGMSLRQALASRGFVIAAGVGLALVSLGLAGTARDAERVLWLILTLVFVAQAWRAWRAGNATPS